ncbi:MAG: extracellular solute-binding protein [Intrasporangium sp.]|uniref:sugar ABC transporter substrate-binding protein n=1 Tax=Intrasporangium sp. TaxID=1925024 RepID=UPI00264922D2|nr:extracellular solute-binding protein [Intrasporangium sp.]MDN5796528.1 extracellular solute-binding protein [Intrasporangium sp.]
MRAPHLRGVTAFALAAAGALVLSACGGGGFSNGNAPAQNTKTGPVKLTVMIGSSGDAETNAVKEAGQAWATKTGNTVEVIAAADLGQQLGQAFASTSPPDLFYTDASKIGTYAKAGDLYAYGDQVTDAGFLPSLVKAFTYKGTFYCAPKDYSTLALEVNTDMWKAADLTDADIPKTWDQLEAVAKKLTKGKVTGLVIGNDINRSGAFMKQAGGWIVSDDGTKMTATSGPPLVGLQEVQKLMKAGVLKFNTDTSPATGWGGEAFGKGIAAMTIEGNWIAGGMKDFPNIKYKTYELPAGPGGKGTLLFSNCWGIAAKSANHAQSVDLVKFLISVDQQMKFAAAFGVMPSTEEGAKQFAAKYPDDAAFVAGGEYGQGPVNLPGFDQVMAKFNSELAQLGKGADPKKMLADLQKNGTAAIADNG